MAEMNTIQGGGMFGAVKQVMGLFNDINKGDSKQSQEIEQKDEYDSSFSEDELNSLANQWEKNYVGYYMPIEKLQDKALMYWLGQQKTDMVDTIENRDMVVNQLFQAIETFLPIATRANPEPVVSSDNTDEGQKLASLIKDALVFEASRQKLKRKLARATRQWMIYLIGALEVDYDVDIDNIKTTVINPKRFIFDKDGSIDESGLFQGEYLGIKCKCSASKLALMFPKHTSYIRSKVNGKMGTKLEYIKWYYKGTDVFFRLDNKVLGKFKNPHWNYDGENKIKDPMTGVEMVEEIQGVNHLPRPIAPYVFLSIFSLGIRPHDETSLILQNIPQQDQINKRYRQIDRNVDSQNNGLVCDGRLMTAEQSGEAAGALRRGASIRVMGDPNVAIARPIVPQLPSDVWNSVTKAEQNLQNIFGTSGSTPSGIKSEESARGKIMISQMDSSRIGGGVTEYIEQVAETVYNLWIQMMYVHYDTEHFFNILGNSDGQEASSLIKTSFIKSIGVTVKEGSLIPKDPLTKRNEAVDLWSQGAIDPLNLYKKLDFPDPNAAVQSLILWQMYQKGAISPEMYLPSFQVQAQPQAMGQTPGIGGQAVNAPTGQEIQSPTNTEGTQTGEAIQSKQLLNSIPV